MQRTSHLKVTSPQLLLQPFKTLRKSTCQAIRKGCICNVVNQNQRSGSGQNERRVSMYMSVKAGSSPVPVGPREWAQCICINGVG